MSPDGSLTVRERQKHQRRHREIFTASYRSLACAVAFSSILATKGHAEPLSDKAVFTKTNAAISEWRNESRPDLPLKPIKPSARIGDCAWYVAFRPDAARAALIAQRDELVAKFDAKEQAALRAYIIDEFPLQLADTTTQCLDGPVVLKDSLRDTKKKEADFINAISSRKNFAVAVDINSTPKGATFSLTPKYDEDWLAVPTNTTIKRLWRGKYRYRVELDGYIPIHGERSLMDGERISISCELVKKPDPAPSGGSAAAAGVSPSAKPCDFQ